MPILGTAIMDTERIIPQNGSSPGSGGSSNGGINSNIPQSSHMMHNSSNHLPPSQQLNYTQQHGVNSGYQHQQYVNGHTTANMLQGGGGMGQSPSPIQHQGNANVNISSTSNLNATYSTMTGGVGGGNIMRKKKSERTIVPLPPTSNTELQPPPNYNNSNGVVGGYGNNAVTIGNQNQFSSSNHMINIQGQQMSSGSPAQHANNVSSHPAYGNGGHNYGADLSSGHQIATKSGVLNGGQNVSSGGIMNHGYTRDNR